MNNFYKSIAIALLLLPVFTVNFAADSVKMAEPMKDMGMMGGMSEEYLQFRQQHIQMMQKLSDQILLEKDLAKKEALKKQRELMKANHAAIISSYRKM